MDVTQMFCDFDDACEKQRKKTKIPYQKPQSYSLDVVN